MLYVSDSKIHEHGVFTNKAFKENDTIELCPYLIVDEKDLGEDCILHDYMFKCPEENCNDFLIVLGMGMVYNHCSNPNAEWEICEEDNRFIRFFALKPIQKGEEILHDYGEEYWGTRPSLSKRKEEVI